MTQPRATAGNWSMAVAVAIVALFLYGVRAALPPFLVAAAVGFALEPVVAWGQRRTRSHRWPMAVILSLALYGLLGAGAFWLGAMVWTDLNEVIGRAPEIVRGFVGLLVGKGFHIGLDQYDADRLTQLMLGQLHEIQFGPLAATVGGGALSGLFFGILTLVLIPYLMVSGPRIAAGLMWLVPPGRRGAVTALLPKLVPMLRRYIVGMVVIVTLTAMIAWAGFGPVFGLPHAALIAVTVGVLELVPGIGPLLSALLVALIALQRGDAAGAALLIGFAIALRVAIDTVLAPVILGKSVQLHPIAIMFAFLCGATLYGVMGLLLAVPVASTIKLILEYAYAEDTSGDGSD